MNIRCCDIESHVGVYGWQTHEGQDHHSGRIHLKSDGCVWHIPLHSSVKEILTIGYNNTRTMRTENREKKS